MKLFETEALVLRRKKINAYDSYLTLFSRELGRVEVYASGANHPKNALNKGAQPFVYGYFSLSGSQNFSLRNVEVIKNFYRLREDLESLLIGSYVSRILLELLEERESNKGLFESLVNTLSIIEKYRDRSQCALVHYYGVIVKEMGIKPHVESCLECGNPEAYFFDAEAGGFFCKEHARVDLKADPTLKEELSKLFIMKLVDYLNHHKDEEQCVSLEDHLEEYMSIHLGLAMKDLKAEFNSYFE